MRSLVRCRSQVRNLIAKRNQRRRGNEAVPIPALDFRMPHSTAPVIQLSLQILQGLLTPVIGATAVYIAWQQWKTNQRKYVLDRYERRLRVYQCVVETLRLINKDFRPDLQELFKFNYDTAEATFLFGPEI